MKYWFVILSVIFVTTSGCRRNPEPLPFSFDSLKPGDSTGLKPADTARPVTTSDSSSAPAVPMAKAVDPTRLAQFLPNMPGWTQSGELEHELQIRDNFNKSTVGQVYTQGSKKLHVVINDFANVPFLYEPWQKFKGNYLDDDNIARTETTTLAGYRAVQSMEKREPHAEITVFPGSRYVVQITMDGAETINDARRVAEGMNLRGLEVLQ